MKFGTRLKRIIGIGLAGIMVAGVLASCGAKAPKNTDNNHGAESSVNNTIDGNAASTPDGHEATSTFSPKADDKAAEHDGTVPTVKPQTAEEAANDAGAIANEIASLEQLIAEGNFDDAMMQIRALLTKNLTEAQKEVVESYRKLVEDKMSGGLTD